MPIIVNPPVPVVPVVPETDETDIPTQRPYRFAGYHFFRDVYGNIIKTFPYVSQPDAFSRRGEIEDDDIILMNP